MDFEAYRKTTNTSDQDYWDFVVWLSNRTADDLRQAKAHPDDQKMVLCGYYKRGDRAGLSMGELIDFLAVSSPSILDVAGYDDLECAALMAISDALTDREIEEESLTT